MQLSFQTQKYDWGKKGNNSFVAQLAKSATPCLKIEEETPYAELWMGTHPNGPSIIAETGQNLSDFINEHSDYLGEKTISNFGKQLPFLFKVLSVAKALSIQAHPNKNHAQKLHAASPELYKDPNHKPELAVALTPFEAMCGFRPEEEIKSFLQTVPELKAVVGEDNVNKFMSADEEELSDALRDCFQGLMTQKQDMVTQQLQLLLNRMKKLDESCRASQFAELIERLNKQFPNDIGCFSVYFLNVITLEPGQALYLGPNEPHAYLSGDCIECMACSDNVVRAGLTPKFKDVDTLCEMLTYRMEHPKTKLFTAKVENEFTEIYAPPVKDFAVAKIIVPTNVSIQTITRESASIILVVSGVGKCQNMNFEKGSVYFLPGKKSIKISDVSSELLMFQAFANV